MTSKEYNQKTTISVNISKNSNDFNYLKDPENWRENLINGQEVEWNANDEIRIHYHVFPCLNLKAFFRPELRKFVIPKDHSEEINSIKTKLSSKFILAK